MHKIEIQKKLAEETVNLNPEFSQTKLPNTTSTKTSTSVVTKVLNNENPVSQIEMNEAFIKQEQSQNGLNMNGNIITNENKTVDSTTTESSYRTSNAKTDTPLEKGENLQQSAVTNSTCLNDSDNQKSNSTTQSVTDSESNISNSIGVKRTLDSTTDKCDSPDVKKSKISPASSTGTTVSVKDENVTNSSSAQNINHPVIVTTETTSNDSQQTIDESKIEHAESAPLNNEIVHATHVRKVSTSSSLASPRTSIDSNPDLEHLTSVEGHPAAVKRKVKLILLFWCCVCFERRIDCINTQNECIVKSLLYL